MRATLAEFIRKLTFVNNLTKTTDGWRARRGKVGKGSKGLKGSKGFWKKRARNPSASGDVSTQHNTLFP